jgi:hypothetical protein
MIYNDLDKLIECVCMVFVIEWYVMLIFKEWILRSLVAALVSKPELVTEFILRCTDFVWVVIWYLDFYSQ